MANGINNNLTSLYSTRAHVFQIEPEEKKSWITINEKAITISFVVSNLNQDQDQEKSEPELRLIGLSENGETLLNTKIEFKTIFAKRTLKFGQFTDSTDTVYGLGFNSESELFEFMNKFQKLKMEILSSPAQQLQHQLNQPLNNSSQASNLQSQTASQVERSTINQQNLNNISEKNGRFPIANNGIVTSAQEYSNTLGHPGDQQLRRKRNGNTSLTNGNSDNGGDANLGGYPRSQSMMGLQQPKPGTSGGPKWPQEPRNSPRLSQSEWPSTEPLSIEQLKYENERLKQALEDSSKNAGWWNDELRNLKTNNFKLTQALQESRAHVEEWERELLSLREQNDELKRELRLLSSESSNDPEKGNEYKNEIQKYKSYIDEVQSELRRKETQVDELQKSMQDMELKNKVSQSDQHDRTPEQAELSAQNKQELEVINAKLESKVKGLVDIQKELKQLVQSLSN